MKWINVLGGVACAILIYLGSRQALPEPHPDPAPIVVDDQPLIDGDGLHVLIVEEVDDRRSLPRDQLAVLTSSTLRGWFTDHQAQWHVWDQGFDTSHEEPKWQAAMRIPRQSLPWMIVSRRGKPNFSGPLPTNLPAALELLNPYAE